MLPVPQTAPLPAPAFSAPARRLLATLTSFPALVVAGGHPESSRLSHYFLAAPLLRGEGVLFLDAANCFNPYRLVAFAEQCRRPPAELLARVRVSRAFTCFQLAELIERTPAAARRYRARCVVLTGMPDIFDDEELAPAEVKAVFQRALEAMRAWPRQGLTALVFSNEPARRSPLRGWLERTLAAAATAAYRLEETLTGLALVVTSPSLWPPCLCGEKTLTNTPDDQPQRHREHRGMHGEDHGTHGRHLSSTDRAEPGALRPLSPRPAPRRPAGVR